MRHHPIAIPCVVLGALFAGSIGCAWFSTVRSAEVTPGSTVVLHASVASPPGADASWFHVIECASSCSRPLLGGDLHDAHAVRTGSRHPVALGGGVNGVYPYVDGHVQLDSSRGRPFGVGARIGLPVWSWMEHQLYGRVDFPLDGSTRLLWNPGVVLHTGQSPNGENPGSLISLVQGLGVQHAKGSMVLTPSIAMVAGRAVRGSGPQRTGPTYSVCSRLQG